MPVRIRSGTRASTAATRWRVGGAHRDGSSAASGGPPRLDPVYPATLGEVEIRSLVRYEEVTA